MAETLIDYNVKLFACCLIDVFKAKQIMGPISPITYQSNDVFFKI